MISVVRKLYLFIIIGIVLLLILLAGFKFGAIKGIAGHSNSEQAGEAFYIGEEMLYDVKLGGVKLGTALFRRPADNRIIFETDVVNFHDSEVIYANPKTLLPLRIERKVTNWLNCEEIVEEYNQKEFTVTITRGAASKESPVVIKKEGPVQNAILLPHYVRRIPEIKTDYTLDVHLPLRDFEIKLASIEKIQVPAGIFETYHFVSAPRQIEIWISNDERRIPLKLQGIGAFNYTLVLKEYKGAGEDAREQPY